MRRAPTANIWADFVAALHRTAGRQDLTARLLMRSQWVAVLEPTHVMHRAPTAGRSWFVAALNRTDRASLAELFLAEIDQRVAVLPPPHVMRGAPTSSHEGSVAALDRAGGAVTGTFGGPEKGDRRVTVFEPSPVVGRTPPTSLGCSCASLKRTELWCLGHASNSTTQTLR